MQFPALHSYAVLLRKQEVIYEDYLTKLNFFLQIAANCDYNQNFRPGAGKLSVGEPITYHVNTCNLLVVYTHSLSSNSNIKIIIKAVNIKFT